MVGAVADLILEDSSPQVQATCLDLLERIGATVTLHDIRTDGWFERLGEQIDNFQRICEVVGDRFLAYSMILGIQLQSLVVDPVSPPNSSVEFTVGDEMVQTLSLGEFRIRVVQAMFHDERFDHNPKLPITADDAAVIIGERNLLLAPLFGISLEQFVLGSIGAEDQRGLVGYFSQGGFNFIDLRDFDELIKGKVRRDLSGSGEEPFKLDLSLVDQAREASKKDDPDTVIATLETWPGLLSILQRTSVGKELTEEKREIIAEGLELLGAAFEQRARQNWSEELYRLGLQFDREGKAAGRLFWRLGMLMNRHGRFGEAIGPLRRAIELGADKEKVLPSLGRAFLRREKLMAAAAILENATAIGIKTPELSADLKRIREILKEANITWDIPLVETKSK